MIAAKPAAAGKAIALALGLAALAAPAAAQQMPHYRITKTVKIGAPDRWDYLLFDPSMNRVYISHGDRITVVDAQSGKLLGDIEGMPGGTHGIAITTGGMGFTDDGGKAQAVMFDPKTLKVTKRIAADKDADGIAYDPKSDHVFVADGDPGMVTVIDGKSGKAIANVDARGKVEFLVAGDNGKLYVNGEERKEIVRVDIATNKVDAEWTMPYCESPHGLALDAANNRLFSTCANGMVTIMDATNGHIVASLPIGQGSDAARFDPVHKMFFSSNFDGTITPIAEETPDKFTVLPPIKTELGARTMAIDPKSGRIFTVTADFKVNQSVPATDRRHRYTIVPGSAKLLILDR